MISGVPISGKIALMPISFARKDSFRERIPKMNNNIRLFIFILFIFRLIFRITVVFYILLKNYYRIKVVFQTPILKF